MLRFLRSSASRWLILLPALLGIAFNSSQAEAYQVGLNAVGYTFDEVDGIPVMSDTLYSMCHEELENNINRSFEGEPFGDCPQDFFMVHYTGSILIPEHTTIEFAVGADDGGVMNIGGNEFGDWTLKGCSWSGSGNLQLEATNYPLDFWFYEWGGGTCAMMFWKIDDQDWQIVPDEAFTSEPPTTAIEQISTTVPSTTMPESTTSILSPSTTTVELQTALTVPETTSSITTTSTTTTTISTVPVTLYLPPTTTTEPSTTTTEPIPESQSTTTTTTPEVTTTTEQVTTTTSQQPIPTTIPENPTTSVLSLPDEAKPALSNQELVAVLDALGTADKAEVQALVTQVLAKDLDTSQAASLVSSPAVLASVTSDQATALFEEISPAELTPAEAEAVVAAVQDAPTSVRKAFEAVLNLFQGFADNYVMTGQQVPIKTRRALIALTAVFLTLAPAPSRRNK
jgi:hypothetical protein